MNFFLVFVSIELFFKTTDFLVDNRMIPEKEEDGPGLVECSRDISADLFVQKCD